MQLQRRRVGIAAQPLGRLGEGGDGGRDPPGEQEGQRRGHQDGGQEPQQDALAPGVQQARAAGLDDPPAAVRLPQPQPKGADQHRLARTLGQFEQAWRLAPAELAPAKAAGERLELQGRADRPAREDHVGLLHAQIAGDALLGAETVALGRRRRRLGPRRLDPDLEHMAGDHRHLATAQHQLDVMQLVDLGLGPRQGEDHRRIDQHHRQHAGQAEAEHQDEQRQPRGRFGGCGGHLQTTGASNI